MCESYFELKGADAVIFGTWPYVGAEAFIEVQGYSFVWWESFRFLVEQKTIFVPTEISSKTADFYFLKILFKSQFVMLQINQKIDNDSKMPNSPRNIFKDRREMVVFGDIKCFTFVFFSQFHNVQCSCLLLQSHQSRTL